MLDISERCIGAGASRAQGVGRSVNAPVYGMEDEKHILSNFVSAAVLSHELEDSVGTHFKGASTFKSGVEIPEPLQKTVGYLGPIKVEGKLVARAGVENMLAKSVIRMAYFPRKPGRNAANGVNAGLVDDRAVNSMKGQVMVQNLIPMGQFPYERFTINSDGDLVLTLQQDLSTLKLHACENVPVMNLAPEDKIRFINLLLNCVTKVEFQRIAVNIPGYVLPPPVNINILPANIVLTINALFGLRLTAQDFVDGMTIPAGKVKSILSDASLVLRRMKSDLCSGIVFSKLVTSSEGSCAQLVSYRNDVVYSPVVFTADEAVHAVSMGYSNYGVDHYASFCDLTRDQVVEGIVQDSLVK
jgi:hypothetical protein